jgi:hypothetical protein
MKLITVITLILCFVKYNFAQQDIRHVANLTLDSINLTLDSTGLAMDSTIASDTVNIREMVIQQILAAKKKMLEEKQSKPQTLPGNKKKVLKKSNKDKSVGILERISEFLSRANEDIARVILLGGSTFLVFGTVLIRRIKIKKKRVRRKKLVKNINSIREEKVIVKEDPKLKDVRIKLKSNPEHFITENSFDETAKELNIAKGELLLAARIKSYELSKITS